MHRRWGRKSHLIVHFKILCPTTEILKFSRVGNSHVLLHGHFKTYNSKKVLFKNLHEKDRLEKGP